MAPPSPTTESRPVVVVGAGAAGILASLTLAHRGIKPLLLEKTDRVGTKILVSGGGKCNITHDGPLEEVLRAFRQNEARFLRPSFYRYTPQDIVELLTDHGLEVYTRPNGRIFPVNQTAKDVCAILHRLLIEAGVEIRLESPLRDITKTDDGFLLATDHSTIQTPNLVLCVGGSSFPRTGTTGDGYPWVTKLDHTLVPIQAALAPIELVLDQNNKPKAGVALRDCLLRAKQNNKEIARWRDDLLFTHRGVSGPTVLGLSREVAECIETGPVSLHVDLLPDLTFEQLSQTLRDAKTKNPNRRVVTLVWPYLPTSLVEPFWSSIPADPDARLQSIDKKLLNRLVETLKDWNIGRVKEVVLDKGEVVAGGVALDEVDPHTMESKLVPGLYLCGEILDIAGPVGGYNLQAAWSTGFVAGDSVPPPSF